MRTTTAHKPWWLLPRYAIAQPVITTLALIVGLTAATGAVHVLHTGPTVAAAAAMLACSGAGYGLRKVRCRLLDRINGSPQARLAQVFRDIETQAIARFCAETTTPGRAVDALLVAVMPADAVTPDHHSARDGAR